MAISDRTRKLLWAKSGNRCAICKTALLSKKDSEDFNIGEECHIISGKPNGPRHKEGLGEYDSVDNLILLCRNHHREIDELVDSYTEELLIYMKMNHENWVQKTIDDAIETNKEDEPRFLARVTSGKELLNILTEAHGYNTGYPDPENEEEAGFTGSVIQELIDYGDISGMVEAQDKIKMAYQLKELISRIEERGYFLFAERNVEDYKEGGHVFKDWSIATIVLKKKDDPVIIKLDLTE